MPIKSAVITTAVAVFVLITGVVAGYTGMYGVKGLETIFAKPTVK